MSSLQNREEASIHASLGVAIREFPLKSGHGFADYMLYVDGMAAGVRLQRHLRHVLHPYPNY